MFSYLLDPDFKDMGVPKPLPGMNQSFFFFTVALTHYLAAHIVCSFCFFKNKSLSFFLAAVCEFEMSGPEGIIESQQIIRDGKALQTEAVDCKWFIRASPRSKVSAVSFW